MKEDCNRNSCIIHNTSLSEKSSVTKCSSTDSSILSENEVKHSRKSPLVLLLSKTDENSSLVDSRIEGNTFTKKSVLQIKVS